MMDLKSYYHFEDFILDDSFREYILKTDQKSVEEWEAWIVQHPELTEEIKRASDTLLTLNSRNKISVASNSKVELKKLLRSIRSEENQVFTFRKISVQIARIAAVLIIGAGLMWTGRLLFTPKDAPVEALSYNEIIVPVGEKSQIILSDGTHVWINSGSRFKYPLNFGVNSRQVMLEGEAYFDVTKNKKDFVVTTHDVDIRVLGTAFNVKSYPEDERTQTTVVRGLVKVYSKIEGSKPVLIGPQQMAVIRKTPNSNLSSITGKKLTVVDHVNTVAVTSWKDQLLVFADETFEDLAIKMERWYNIHIRIDDKTLKKERYTGKFVNNETVYQVLEAIAVTTPIQYKNVKDEIVITRKNSNKTNQ